MLFRQLDATRDSILYHACNSVMQNLTLCTYTIYMWLHVEWYVRHKACIHMICTWMDMHWWRQIHKIDVFDLSVLVRVSCSPASSVVTYVK